MALALASELNIIILINVSQITCIEYEMSYIFSELVVPAFLVIV